MIRSVHMTRVSANLTDLKREAYFYHLPSELIADRPVPERDKSRLMIYSKKNNEIIHTHFYKIADFLPSKTTLVMNDSKVFPCRLLGQKKSGGKIEVFFLSLITQDGLYPVLIKSSNRKNIADEFEFGELKIKIEAKNEDYSFLVSVNLSPKQLEDFLNKEALVPIPPYIRQGQSDEKDKVDYQTVYAQSVGSVAAPTAGLHFTQDVFDSLKNKGIEKAFVTLHVGAGTFLPVKSDDITEHQMHSEYYSINKEELRKIQKGNLIAVGTTSLRVLESAWDGQKVDFDGGLQSTNIFLYSGKEIHSVKGLITNFHLPESSLIMLVSALIGREKTLELYQEAITHKYRFFSYGDAMLILLD